MQMSAEQIAAYERDGAVLLEGVVSEDWRQRLAAAIERDIATPGPFCHSYVPEDGRGRFHGNLKIWQNDPDFRAFCLTSPLPALAAQLFGGAKQVHLLYDQLFVKEPGTANRTRWHNDQPYWPVSGWQVASFWVALDPVSEHTGRLEFVRGSHRWDRWFQPEPFGRTAGPGYDDNPDYEPMPDIEAARDDYDIIAWDMQPGDVLAFQALAVHGAGGNHDGSVRRRGYTVRYTGDDARYSTRPGTSKPLQDPDLADGAPLSGPEFPLVWPAASAGG